jgi:hypothetical protein
MRYLLLSIICVSLLISCSNGGGGGKNDRFGREKPGGQPLSAAQKEEFLDLIASMDRAKNARDKLTYPNDKIGDADEKKMYDALTDAGCKANIVYGKDGDKATYHETIHISGCPIDFTYHREGNNVFATETEDYMATEQYYKNLNDVYGRQYYEETRINGMSSGMEGQGVLYTKKYGPLEFYTFRFVEAIGEKDGNGTATRMVEGFGIPKLFGHAQRRKISENGVTQTQINGEIIQ